MKLRIAFGLDLEALTQREHEDDLHERGVALAAYLEETAGRPVTHWVRVAGATGIVEFDSTADLTPTKVTVDMALYRWVNVSREN